MAAELDEDDLDDSEEATVRAPAWPVVPLAALWLVSAGLWWAADRLVMNGVGLAVAIVAFGGLLAYRRVAAEAADDLRFERVRWVGWTMAALVVLIIVLFPLHSYPLALEVAER